MLSRFNTAASLNSAAHYFDLLPAKDEAAKQMNTMIAQILFKESRKMEDLGIYELTNQPQT
jgi:hypothetical protein